MGTKGPGLGLGWDERGKPRDPGSLELQCCELLGLTAISEVRFTEGTGGGDRL